MRRHCERAGCQRPVARPLVLIIDPGQPALDSRPRGATRAGVTNGTTSTPRETVGAVVHGTCLIASAGRVIVILGCCAAPGYPPLHRAAPQRSLFAQDRRAIASKGVSNMLEVTSVKRDTPRT